VTVTLETGATDRTCTFTITSATTGTCNYTVQAGDTSPDLTVVSIVGVIRDGATNTMVDFVPAVNLAANKAIIVDTTPPIISKLEYGILRPAGLSVHWVTNEPATSVVEYSKTVPARPVDDQSDVTLTPVHVLSVL